MVKQVSESSQRLLKGLLLFLGMFAFIIVFAFSFSVFREEFFGAKTPTSEPTPTAPSQESSERMIHGSLSLTGNITELIAGKTDVAEGKWITVFVESPESIREVVRESSSPEVREKANEPFPAEMGNKTYKFFLEKDGTEGMETIRGGERVTVFVSGALLQEGYTRASKIAITQ